MDYRSNCVKKSKCSKFYFKTFYPFFKKKKSRSLTNILHGLQGPLLMAQDLILALKTDNVKACFILSGISFHSLDPKLDIVSVPKCTVCVFHLAKCMPLLKL